jgi:hypothetical protein
MPPPLTTTQVLQNGDYLSRDFDPSSLTVPQLLGILTYHNIRCAMPYRKGTLIEVFKGLITTQSAALKAEHQKQQDSMPSVDGITDGFTGKLIRQQVRSAVINFNYV